MYVGPKFLSLKALADIADLRSVPGPAMKMPCLYARRLMLFISVISMTRQFSGPSQSSQQVLHLSSCVAVSATVDINDDDGSPAFIRAQC